MLAYDRQGHLVWANDGIRPWVQSRAKASAAGTTGPAWLKGFEWHSSTGAAGSKPSGLKTPWGILTPLIIIGLLAVIIGLIVVANAIGSDVTTPDPTYETSDRYNNIGLMNDQRNGIIGGILVAVVGGALLVVAYSRGELDDWFKRVPAAGGRSLAVTGESQSAAPTPLVTPLAAAAPRAATTAAPTPLVEQPPPAAMRTQEAVPTAPPAKTAPTPKNAKLTDAPATSVADEIAKLAGLHAKGILTDEEFAGLKAKLI